MKILLISPIVDIEMRREKGLIVPQLALYILEGLTSPEHIINIIEEETEDVNLDEDCDLVGISCMTSNAPRAYWLSGVILVPRWLIPPPLELILSDGANLLPLFPG